MTHIPTIKAIRDQIKANHEKQRQKITKIQIMPPMSSNELTGWQREDIHYEKPETWPTFQKL